MIKEYIMIEIPEAATLARQVSESLTGRTVQTVIAGAYPHKFAWFKGNPADYPRRLEGCKIVSAVAQGGMVEVHLDRATLLFHDGVKLRLHPEAGKLPAKHQLLITFTDDSILSASVQMYGGLYCWEKGEVFDYSYYNVARVKPSPLNTNLFNEAYFIKLLDSPSVQKLSTKAALATNQRVPGLGNGVLQDILWNARISPRRKVNTLSAEEINDLYTSVTSTLAEMTRLGGRDTEKDLFGQPGGYITLMSAKNAGAPCPECGTPIRKEAYLGGSVYYCPECQL
jgi:formamidopyrimidine-DNA glycosylase